MGITKELLWQEVFLTKIKDAFDGWCQHKVNPLQIHGRS